MDRVGCPALLCNSQFKGIQVQTASSVYRWSINDPPLHCSAAPHAKWFGSDLASPGRLHQLAPGNQWSDLRLEDGSWKLQNKRAAKSWMQNQPYHYWIHKKQQITVSQEIKSTLNLRQIFREAEELGKDGEWRWGGSSWRWGVGKAMGWVSHTSSLKNPFLRVFPPEELRGLRNKM